MAQHSATLTVAITRPAYDVTHPAVTIYAANFEAGDHTLAGEGFIASAGANAYFYTTERAHSGTYAAEPWVKDSARPGTQTSTFTKPITGLTVGRSYTFSAWVLKVLNPGEETDNFSVGVVGIGNGANVVIATTWKQATFTFTATATTHSVVITGGESSAAALFSLMFVDDVLLIQNAWTEHFPPVTATPVPLDVKDVSATLDDSWSPYAQATLNCWTPPQEVLEFIEPRNAMRAVVTLTDGTVTRTINGVLRARTVDHKAGAVEISVGSDEALLIDKARVATTVDTSAAAYQTSLRALINAVVLAPIGAVLEADAGADADLTAGGSQINAFVNPSAETNATGWVTPTANAALTRQTTIARFGAASLRGQVTAATSSSVGAFPGTSTAPPFPLAVAAGTSYLFSVWVYTAIPNAVAEAHIRFASASAVIGSDALTTTPIPANTWTQVTVTGTAPSGAVGAAPWINLVGVGNLVTGQNAFFDGFKFVLATGDATYFDGDTPDTASFRYDWTGTAHASASTRTLLAATARDPDMFRWVPGVTAWDFVQPLVQAAGLRLFCDEARKWHLVDPETFTVAGLVQIAADANATDATDTIDRAGEWADSVVVQYQWTNAAGVTSTVWDVDGAPGTKTVTVEKRVPYPGPGAATALLKRLIGRGRVMALRAVSAYTVTPGQALRATLPNTAIQDATVTSVTWSQPADEMNVASRGAVSVSKAAWSYLAAGVKWTDSAAGQSWISEPI